LGFSHAPRLKSEAARVGLLPFGFYSAIFSQ
jgi:hypothetical protein